MELFLCRHGNTFATGDRVVWVGRESDLPLVAAGEAQARTLAAALAARGLAPNRIYCGGLKRTRRYAEIVAEGVGLGAAPIVDDRLNEISFGDWAGRAAEEISRDPTAAAALAAWNERDKWPASAGWETTEAEVRAAVEGFLADLAADGAGAGGGAGARPLVVSSNGILRFFPRLLGLAVAGGRASYRMKTGNASVLARDGGVWSIKCWDVPPEEIVV